MARDDYFVIVYAILKYLYDCLKDDRAVDFDRVSNAAYGIPFSYWCFIIESMQEQGYIKGLAIKDTKDGKMLLNSGHTQITPEGIEYLFENSLMQKVQKTLKGIKDIIPGI